MAAGNLGDHDFLAHLCVYVVCYRLIFKVCGQRESDKAESDRAESRVIDSPPLDVFVQLLVRFGLPARQAALTTSGRPVAEADRRAPAT